MSEQPFVLMIAGPNGSGKTTLTNELRRREYDFGEYINADDIALTLEGAYDERVRAAQKLADERRAACVAELRSFSFETVMSHPSKVELLARAREAGFITLLYFVSTEDPSLNVARVQQRVALGGHDVPRERIIARYRRTMDLLPAAIEAADQIVLFDNTRRYGPGDAVVLRPFLMMHRRPAPLLNIEHPVPHWGRPVIWPTLPRWYAESDWE